MNYICRKDREQTEKTFSSLRRSGKSYGTTTGCEKTLQCRGDMVVVIVERCCVDTDEPYGNEFGCWCGVCCSAAKRENHGDVDS